MLDTQKGVVARSKTAPGDARVSLRITNLRKSFGPVVALHDVNLSVYDHEIISFLGPSGCGKTTLMRLIGGFEDATQGSIEIDGAVVDKTPPERRPVNMVFQRYALFPHLDVFDNIAFGLDVSRTPRAEKRDRVREMLRIVQMEYLADRRISALSGGQCQRVALARALVNRPKILLLDEPLAALDLKIRQHMLGELRRIHSETKATFIYVTHDQDEALVLSDRVVLMKEGRIMQVDRPYDIYHHPKSVFAARFLGEANVLTVAVIEARGSRTIVKTPNGLTLEVGGGGDAGEIGAAVGAEGYVSIRPEMVRLTPAGRGAQPQSRGVLEKVTFMGSRSFCSVRLEHGDVLSLQVQGADLRALPEIGSAVDVAWDATDLTLLLD